MKTLFPQEKFDCPRHPPQRSDVMKRLCALIPLLFLPACAQSPHPVTTYFLSQARAAPEVRIEDAYKWLFHATRGGEHAIENEIATLKWLEKEWTTLTAPLPDEPLWVPLTPDGRIGRLNLRPYKAQGGDLLALHHAFVAGAASFNARPNDFLQAWRALGRALPTTPDAPLTQADWKQFDARMRAKKYPACHHSAAYQQARQPAYRVLPAPEARQLLQALPNPPPAP